MARRRWLHLPGRTVRVRLTALYGGLFLLSGAALLAITYALVAGQRITTAFRIAGAVKGDFRLVPAGPQAQVLLRGGLPPGAAAALRRLLGQSASAHGETLNSGTGLTNATSVTTLPSATSLP
ncbi:MAG: hypothetical protein ABSA91_11920, partial [Acidimicrobiales bacterium]